jgi:hypothetical protein
VAHLGCALRDLTWVTLSQQILLTRVLKAPSGPSGREECALERIFPLFGHANFGWEAWEIEDFQGLQGMWILRFVFLVTNTPHSRAQGPFGAGRVGNPW